MPGFFKNTSRSRDLLDVLVHRTHYDFCKYFLGSLRPNALSANRYITAKIHAERRLEIGDSFQELLGHDGGRIEWPIPEINAYSFPEVYLAGEAGYVYAADGKRLFDCSLPLRSGAKVRKTIKTWAHRIATPGVRYFHLLGENLHNRAHFIVEQAPRLFLANRAFPDSEHTILLGNSPSGWLEEYLALFDLGDSRILEAPCGTTKVSELDFIPNPCGNLISFDRRIYEDMCSHFAGKCETADSGRDEARPKVIWISREDARHRKMTNQPEMVRAWEDQFGKCRLVNLSAMDFQSQVNELSGAECIIAEQGQAMNLLAFLRGKVVVMLDRAEPQFCHTWNCAFLTLSQFSKNLMLRLFSGEKGDHKENWCYPVEKFKKDLEKIRQLSAQGRMDPIWYGAHFHQRQEL